MAQVCFRICVLNVILTDYRVISSWQRNIGLYLHTEWHKQICRITNEIAQQFYSDDTSTLLPQRLLAFRVNTFSLFWLVHKIDEKSIKNIYFHTTVEHGPDQLEKFRIPFIVLSEEQGEADCHPGINLCLCKL